MGTNTFKYELLILDPSLHKYIEATEETETFIQAVFSVLMKNKKLCGKMLTIYCRKPKSGDLQYMGKFDGMSSNIINLSNGLEYYLTDDGFELL